MVYYSHLFKTFPVCYDPHKGFSIVNEAEVDVFLELLLFLSSKECWQFDLWFLSFPKSGLNTWKFLVYILLKPGLEDFEHDLVSK